MSKTSVRSRSAALWRLALAVSVCTVGLAAAQKPIRQVEIHGEGVQPPETLEELWQQSAVVIEGRVEELRPANQTVTPSVSLPAGAPARPATLVGTDYVVQVRRVLKADDVIGSETSRVTVRRLGGTVESGDYIAEMIEPHFAKFKPRGRYVLFLKGGRGEGASSPLYFPAAGADSAFELHGNDVVPLGRARASRRLAAYGADQLVAALAKMGGR